MFRFLRNFMGKNSKVDLQLPLKRTNTFSYGGLSWSNSKSHLLLLSEFVHAKEINHFTGDRRWQNVLNEPAEQAIRRFVDEGMLCNADLNTVVSYKYKVTELKDMLR